MKSKWETTREFLIALLVVFIVALMLYWFVSFVTKENMGDTGSFMSGVFGSAVALAGAFVAVKLASYAIKLQEDQESRENIQSHFEMLHVISSNLERSIQPIIAMVKNIQDLYAIASIQDSLTISLIEKHHVTFPLISKYISNEVEVPPEMKKELNEIRARGTRRMQETLMLIATDCRDNPALFNPIAAFLLTKIGGKEFSVGDYFGNHMLKLSDMQLWAAIFENFANHLAEINQLDDANYLKTIVAYRQAAYVCVDKAGQEFDHVGLRSFLLLGVFCREDLMAAELIFKFFENLPTGNEMVESVKRLFPKNMKMSDGLSEAVENFNLKSNVDRSLQMALDSYREHQPKLIL